MMTRSHFISGIKFLAPSRILRTCLTLSLALFLLSPACKSLKSVSSGEKATAALKKTKANNLKFETLRINGRGNAEVPGQGFSIGIGYKIEIASLDRMRIRITKLGLEGARILITKDSIYVLDRLNRKAYLSGLDMAKSYTGIDADFSLLQAILVGDFKPIPKELKIQKTENAPITYVGTEAGTDFSYFISKDLMKLVGMVAKNVSQNLHTELSYSEFEEEGGQKIASEGAVSVLSPEKASFSFKHSKVEVNPNNISFAFKIPDNYEVVAN